MSKQEIIEKLEWLDHLYEVGLADSRDDMEYDRLNYMLDELMGEQED